MRRTLKRSDVLEIITEIALRFGLLGAGLLALGLLLWRYRGEGYTDGLIVVLVLAGAGLLVYAVRHAWKARGVRLFVVRCPYCNEKIRLTAPPVEDFSCTGCSRMVPVLDGAPLEIHQVRCGYCNALNYYSDKTELLLCEQCNHEVPISQHEGGTQRHVPKAYVVTEDDQMYELVLTAAGPKTEEVIEALQHILAANRSQVKQMLESLPVTLLRGIPRRKAEILQTQLAVHDAVAEFTPIK